MFETEAALTLHRHLAVLGGLASLLALAYGPFVQNLIVITIEYRQGNQTALASFVSSYHSGTDLGDNRTRMISQSQRF